MLLPNGNEYPNKRQALGRPLPRCASPPLVAVRPAHSSISPSTMLHQFIVAYKELECYRRVFPIHDSFLCLTTPSRSGKSVVVDGQSLSIAAVTAAARYNAQVEIDPSPAVADRVGRSRDVIAQKVAAGTSVYGLTTGFGGSGTCYA